MLKNIMYALVFSFISNTSWAGPYDPMVTKAWVGETVPGQTTSTLQMNLTTVKAVNLIAVSSPVAGSVEIHSLMMNKGAMKLQVVNSYFLPEHRTTLFGSQGLFLMMTGIKQPLKIGDQVPLSLTVTFADKQTKVISANAEVRKMELSYKHYGPNEVYDHR
jgi:periplasmic copper chaperone A